ncbi:MAG: FeoA domain-containing protein [Candidatus Omnitrophica bacterium]|nr:FeoA domain-containing protein [Candidatus Omnitrophota bacterium]MBU1868844.1 FeoA domain-containing protein [Candidatus Omnitrophota bacterium]
MRKISLAHLKADHKGRVIEILGGGNIHKRLMSMGIFEGKEISKLSHIGLRGPVVFKVGRSILAVGHGVAEKIIVETE